MDFKKKVKKKIKELESIRSDLKEVKMNVDSLLGIIAENQWDADYSIHPLTKGQIGETTPCSDKEVADFINLLNEGNETALLIVSDIKWLEYGNCAGDELHPVTLSAVKLPGIRKRYYLELVGKDLYREFIYEVTE